MKSFLLTIGMLSVGALMLTGCVPNEPVKNHRNDSYGFSVSYPARLQIKVHDDKSATIGTQHNGTMTGAIELEVIDVDPVRHLLLTCDADGPDGSIDCTEVRETADVDVDGGPSGVRYTLTERQKDNTTGQEAFRARGPYYVFDLRNGHSLVIRASSDVPADAIDEALLEEILLSLSIDGGHSAASGTGEAASAPSGSARPRAGEGELCGGIAGILCDEGLRCDMKGSYPDAAGTCVR